MMALKRSDAVKRYQPVGSARDYCLALPFSSMVIMPAQSAIAGS
jgi:hypothetical protein